MEQRLERRRNDEDDQSIGDALLHHLGTLNVDLEDRVPPLGEGLANRLARSAVPVAVDLVGLEELVGRLERGELLAIEEAVAHSVDLARSASPRRASDDVVVVAMLRLLAKGIDDRVLPDA